MDSDAPQLDRLSADLVAALTRAVPDAWSVRNAEAQTTPALGVVLFYEQGDLVTTINGGPVPDGYIGVEYTLTLAAPEMDPVAGTLTVTNAVVELLSALDGLSTVFWDRADKVRLTSGETSYRLPIVSLSSYTLNPDPDPVPDAHA